MALLGFSVFKEAVRDKVKRQTIRVIRKKPIREGELLHLYWHLRRPDCERLGVAVCKETFFMSMAYLPSFLGKGDVWRIDRYEGQGCFGCRTFTDAECEELAVRDGFKSAREMVLWFYEHYPNLVCGSVGFLPQFQVIRW